MKNTQCETLLSNAELLESVRGLASDERRLGIEILHHLREIQKRGLHLKLGHASLFSFCVEELKYSESGAYQKLQALKLMTEVPEVEEKLKTGSLTLSNAAQVQTFVQNAQKRGVAIPDRVTLVQKVENQSKRECERILAAQTLVPFLEGDRIRPITADHLEIRFVATQELIQKLEKLKQLRSHVQANPSMAELLEDLADLALKKLDPERDPQGTKQAEARDSSELHPERV